MRRGRSGAVRPLTWPLLARSRQAGPGRVGVVDLGGADRFTRSVSACLLLRIQTVPLEHSAIQHGQAQEIGAELLDGPGIAVVADGARCAVEAATQRDRGRARQDGPHAGHAVRQRARATHGPPVHRSRGAVLGVERVDLEKCALQIPRQLGVRAHRRLRQDELLHLERHGQRRGGQRLADQPSLAFVEVTTLERFAGRPQDAREGLACAHEVAAGAPGPPEPECQLVPGDVGFGHRAGHLRPGGVHRRPLRQRGGSVIRFALYVAVAALFHKTAVLVLPLVIFAGRRNRLLNIVAGAAAFVLFFDLFLAESTDQFVKNYIDTRYSSQGAWIRVILNLIPAVLLLSKRGRFGLTEHEERVWRYIAIAACVMPIILIVTPSSTAVDRMALYLMPLQIVVLSRAYLLFKKLRFGVAAIIIYAFLVQFTWLNFAQHSKLWVPYRSFMLEDTTDRRNDDDRR